MPLSKYKCPKCGENRLDHLFCLRDKLLCSTCDTMFDFDMTIAGNTAITEMMAGIWLRLTAQDTAHTI